MLRSLPKDYIMRRQPLFMKLKHKYERERDPRYRFGFEFNDEHYAIATPEFWDAWRADKDKILRGQYFPAKYPADQVGREGKKPVWVVFSSRDARNVFTAKFASSAEASQTTGTAEAPDTADTELKGLGWYSTSDTGGMFLDERNKGYRSRRPPVVAWLNYNRGHYSVNIVNSTFKLTHRIPTTITGLGDAVKWVYKNSSWIESKS